MDLMKMKQPAKEKEDPFISAIIKGDLKKVKDFLNIGFSPDYADGNSVTGLMYAIGHGHLLVAVALIKAGAFLNKSDYLVTGQTPLMIALSQRNFSITNFLLNAGASVHSINNIGNSVIFYAVQADCLDLVKRFVEEWVIKIDHQNKHKQTAFMLAAREGKVEIAKYLESKGVNINIQDENGITPLMHAIYMKEIKMVEYLTSLRDLEIDLKNAKGNTALNIAGNFGLLIITQMLIKAKASVNLQNNRGQTALMGAAVKGFVEIVDNLLQAGADVTLKDIKGATVLDYTNYCPEEKKTILKTHFKKTKPLLFSQNATSQKNEEIKNKERISNVRVTRNITN